MRAALSQARARKLWLKGYFARMYSETTRESHNLAHQLHSSPDTNAAIKAKLSLLEIA
jgi:hypothetical protein